MNIVNMILKYANLDVLSGLKKDVPREKFDKDLSDSFNFRGTIHRIGGLNEINKLKILMQQLEIDITAENDLHKFTFVDGSLQIPDKYRMADALKQIESVLLVDRNNINQIIINLFSGRNVIIAGPVGTGKTTLAAMISKLFWKDEEFEGYYPATYTATSEWGIEDIIGGILPRIKDNKPSYEIVLGCVSETVSRNWQDNFKVE